MSFFPGEILINLFPQTFLQELCPELVPRLQSSSEVLEEEGKVWKLK
jgi:hypothetical protein